MLAEQTRPMMLFDSEFRVRDHMGRNTLGRILVGGGRQSHVTSSF